MVYDLGIVVPVYRSKESVRILVKQLKKAFEPKVRIQICLVDDSDDCGVSEYLRSHCLRAGVTVVTLAGNYGQQAAILCGLEELGDCRFYGTIDDDLQQPVKALRRLYEKALKGYDVVYGIPKRNGPSPCPTRKGSEGYPLRPVNTRRRNPLRILGSCMRDMLFSCLLGAPRGMRVSSLRVMTAAVAKGAVASRQGSFFYLSAEIYKDSRRRPVRTANLIYIQRERKEGKSGYSLSSLARLWGRIFWHYVLNRRRKEAATTLYRIKEIIK